MFLSKPHHILRRAYRGKKRKLPFTVIELSMLYKTCYETTTETYIEGSEIILPTYRQKK
jgi:hypothetical protein